MLVFDEPLEATNIEIKIIEVFPGSKYKDTCISEVEFFVNYQDAVNRYDERNF